MILEFLGILKWVTFFLQKMHAVNSLSMATLSGTSENGTRNNVHLSNDSKKIILQVLEVIIFF